MKHFQFFKFLCGFFGSTKYFAANWRIPKPVVDADDAPFVSPLL